MRKKILSWLLSVSMVLSMFVSAPMAASAVSYSSGNAAGFDSSSNSYITVPDSNSLDVTNALTFEAWIKPSAGGGEWALIAGKQLNPADSNPWYSYRLLAASANSGEKGFPRKVAFQIAPEGSGETGVESNTVVQNDVWTYVAGVYDGTSVKIYINGVLENSNPVTGDIQVSDLPLYIGKAPWTNYNNYNGLIDEVRVWNVARTAEQIGYDMQYTLTGSEPGLVSYWRFDESFGITTADATGNNNDGNLYNSAYFTASGAPVASPYDGEYNIEAGPVTISANGDYRIYGTGVSTTNTIVINTGVTAHIVLDDININVSGTSDACAFDIQGTAQVNVVLAAGSENTLRSGEYKAGLQVADAAQLTIDTDVDDEGILNSYGGNYGAGIGGAYEHCGGIISIDNGVINANASFGAGAGIGSGLYGDDCDITINGGIITANGSGAGAGIGSGGGGDVGRIYIHGGTVVASSTGNEAGYDGGSGIGSGDEGYNGEILIDGGTVTASGKYDCPGIGGCYGSTGTITIRGAGTTVTASSGLYAAGIGGGYGDGGGVINIEGGAVTANGRYRSPGIGDYDDGTTVINISGGTVLSNGGEEACGIGSGYHSEYNPLPILNFTGGSLSVSHGAGESFDINAVLKTTEGEAFSAGGRLVPASGQVISVAGSVTGVFAYDLNSIAANGTVITSVGTSASGYFVLYPLETGMQIVRQGDSLSWKYAADANQPVLSGGAADRNSDSEVDITFTCNEFAEFFYQVTADGAAIPDIDTTGSGNYCSGETTLTIDSLTPGACDIYLVAKDMAGNESALIKIDIDAYAEDVCRIGDTYYTTLAGALVAVGDGQTITLLKDIEYTSGISITGKDITFDIGGFNLDVIAAGWPALLVDNGSVSLETTGGELNITCNAVDGYGVYVCNGGSAEVSNVNNPNLGYGVFNLGGGTISVSGNVQAGYEGVYVSGGVVSVNGNVQGGYYGTYAHNNGTVNIGGDSIGNTFNGVLAASGAQVTIDGDVSGKNEGAYSEGTGTSIIIGGDVTSTDSTGAYANTGTTISIAGNASGVGHGIYSYEADIYVAGNVTSLDNGVYVVLGEATVDGIITAPNSYVGIDGDHIAADAGVPGTAPYEDYLIYTGAQGGVVRVKIPPAPDCEIGSTQYDSFSDALAAVTNGQTIKLLDDITYNDRIWVGSSYRHSMTIDLNGHSLEVSNVEVPLAALDGCFINITDGSVSGGGILELNTTSSDSAPTGVTAVGTGSSVLIDDKISATITSSADNGKGVSAYNGGTIEIENATVSMPISASSTGVYADGTGSNISITGNISGGWMGVRTNNGTVSITGNVTTGYEGSGSGVYANGGTITVMGNVSSTGGGNYGAFADNGGVINISGNVTSGSVGASVYYGSEITIDGAITYGVAYIQMGYYGNYMNAGNYAASTTKTGYRTYTDSDCTVWVKVVYSTDATLSSLSTSGITLTPTFSSGVTSYSASVVNTVTSTTVTAQLADSNATVTINGTDGASKGISLSEGSNVITVLVTAEDGTTTKTYTMTITRASAGGGGGSPTPVGQEVTVSTPDGTTGVTGTLTESENKEQVTIGGTQFGTLVDADQGAVIPVPSATVTFDQKAVNTINGASSTGDVVLTVEKLDPSTLTPEQQKRVGDRPIYDFTLTKGGQQISNFGGGHAEISIPYTLKPGENPNQVVIYYLADDGSLKTVRGHYDAGSKCVVFETTHFSKYAVGYNQVSFSDVASDAWYKHAVDFIAARGITSGTGNGAYSPDVPLTRGQFVVLLMNAYGISTDSVPVDTANFTDAGNTYYTNYLLAAKSLGIVNGVGNNMFAPEQAITRQEMFVMLYNALKVIGELPATSGTKQLSDFGDANKIASWAQEAMSTLVKGGVISGSNGLLNPTSSTTRAEMAQMLYNLLSK